MEFTHVERLCLSQFPFGLRDITTFLHLAEHQVSAFHTAVVETYWVIHGRVLTHAHECGTLFQRQINRSFIEIGLCSVLDTHRIIEEVEVVEIHGNDFLLRVVALQLHSDVPFHRLTGDTVEGSRFLRHVGIQLLGKLLSDGRTTTSRLLTHEATLHDGASQSTEVDTRMFEETLILSGNQCFHQMLRKGIVRHDYTILRGIAPSTHQLPISRIHAGRIFADWVLQIRDRRQLPQPSFRDSKNAKKSQSKEYDDCTPNDSESFGNTWFLLFFFCFICCLFHFSKSSKNQISAY